MRIFIIVLTAILAVQILSAKEINFDSFFNDVTLRVDYYHTGNATEEFITPDQIYAYGIWAGSTKNLIDNFNNGRYYIKAFDEQSGELIYSKGFDSYFGEYQTTGAAINGKRKTYHETFLMPYPKENIVLRFYFRNNYNELEELHELEVDPQNIDVIRLNYPVHNTAILREHYSGDPHNKLDIAVIGEGYTKKDAVKFEEDIERFKTTLFNYEPYASSKDKINIYGVLEYSPESGVDEPTRGIYKNTAIDATFNSLGSERYLLTENNKALRDIAGNVTYDALFIMVNSDRYGGGGIYNFYCTFTSDNQWYEYLILHEMGHSMSGLADEYYTSSTSYNDFYPEGVEPVEPNITALIPAKIKWSEYVKAKTPIPTPWNKAEFDSLDIKWQIKRGEINRRIAELSRNKATQEEIIALKREYDRLDRERAEAVEEFLKQNKYYNTVGAFEGAGYTSDGLFRPEIDCIMFSKGKKPFCEVCEGHVKKIIKFYSE